MPMVGPHRWYGIHAIDHDAEYDAQNQTHRRKLRIFVKDESEHTDEGSKCPPNDVPVFICRALHGDIR